MIRIENTNYYIDADENCFILMKWNGEYRKDKPTVAYEPKYTYYQYFVNLLEALAKRLLREKVSQANSFEELKQAIGGINAMIARIEKEITPDAITESCQALPRVCGRI